MTGLPPADELNNAAQRLRTATFRGAITMTPTVAALVAAREPLADLLEGVAAEFDPDADIQETDGRHERALAVARALNRQEQQP